MPDATPTCRIAIVGGGIAGLATALGLERAGQACVVFEEASGLRLSGAAVTMWPNGVAALGRLGVATEGMGRRLDRLETRSADGRLLHTVDAARLARRFGVPMMVVPRKTLVTRLADELAETPIRFGFRCEDAVENDRSVVMRFTSRGQNQADYVVAADGHRSVVRQCAFDRGLASSTGWGEWQGLVRVSTPLTDGATGFGAVDRSGAVGLLPADDGVLQWWFALPVQPTEGPSSSTVAMLRARFGRWKEPIPTVLEALSDEEVNYWPYVRHRVPRSLVTSRIALVGDAAHAMPPTLGQGANQALEDAVALSTAFTSTNRDSGLADFNRRRRRRAAIVSRLALRPPGQDTTTWSTRVTARVPPRVATWVVGSSLQAISTVLPQPPPIDSRRNE